MLRREVLAAIGTAAAPRAPPEELRGPDLSIKFSLTRDCDPRDPVQNRLEMYGAIRQVFEETLPDAEVAVSWGTVDASDADMSSSRSTLLWWEDVREGDGHDAHVLIASSDQSDSWETGGVARIGTAAAVASDGGKLRFHPYKLTVLHEIGHCLGLEHDMAEAHEEGGERTSTIMDGESQKGVRLEFSPPAAAELREKYAYR